MRRPARSAGGGMVVGETCVRPTGTFCVDACGIGGGAGVTRGTRDIDGDEDDDEDDDERDVEGEEDLRHFAPPALASSPTASESSGASAAAPRPAPPAAPRVAAFTPAPPTLSPDELSAQLSRLEESLMRLDDATNMMPMAERMATLRGMTSAAELLQSARTQEADELTAARAAQREAEAKLLQVVGATAHHPPPTPRNPPPRTTTARGENVRLSAFAGHRSRVGSRRRRRARGSMRWCVMSHRGGPAARADEERSLVMIPALLLGGVSTKRSAHDRVVCDLSEHATAACVSCSRRPRKRVR